MKKYRNNMDNNVLINNSDIITRNKTSNSHAMCFIIVSILVIILLIIQDLH